MEEGREGLYTKNLFQSALQIDEFHIQTSNVWIYYDKILEARKKNGEGGWGDANRWTSWFHFRFTQWYYAVLARLHVV